MLAPGSRIGPYEVLAPLGFGGMGEVYRARDMRLKRVVALKVLPETFAADPERLARLAREAEMLAALNHAHIAAIYGVEESNGSPAIVMELVEGETLAERIALGAMPLDDALPIARQIAEALEAAHERGIVHRDLKPANVKLRPDGMVKVLDFGLAKLAAAGAERHSSASMSPTITSPALLTSAGMLLGTAAYMSPEQAKGLPADKRSDVWAFGCVLYEMLAGRRAFGGDDVADTLAAVLRGEPDWSALPGDAPPGVARLLRRCLQKQRNLRLRDIGDALLDLQDPEGPSPSAPASVPQRKRSRWAAVGIGAGLLLLTTLAAAMGYFARPVEDAGAVRFDLPLPEGTFALGGIELSPDGRSVAFVAPVDARRTIWVRPLDSAVAKPLSGSDTDRFFWSADGQSIWYAANAQLTRVSLKGGPPQVIAKLPERTYLGTSNADGVVLIGSVQVGGPLIHVTVADGHLRPETELDGSLKERLHTLPRFLPDGRHYFFLAVSEDANNNSAYVGLLGSKRRWRLPGIASQVVYSPSGHVLFLRQGALMAQQFDIGRLQLEGEPFPIEADFTASTATVGRFSVAHNGTLAFQPVRNLLASRLVWTDREGKETGVAAPNGIYVNPELSPDEKYVAYDDGAGPTSEVRIFDLEKRVSTPLTSNPANDGLPQWSRDSRRLIFRSDRKGVGDLYELEIGRLQDKPLLESTITKTPWHWSADERYVAYSSGSDVWAMPLFGGEPFAVTRTGSGATNARIAPDGRWIAYQSPEPGALDATSSQIFVESFPPAGFKRQISANGGMVPRWSPKGDELFYVSPERTLMAVSIRADGSSLEIGAPRELFRMSISSPAQRNYSVTSDGRFLVRVPNEQRPISPITVIVNWAAGLK